MMPEGWADKDTDEDGGDPEDSDEDDLWTHLKGQSR